MYRDGRGVTKDEAQAFMWFLAADQGNARAQFNLGNMYRDGRGVTHDYAEAIKWFASPPTKAKSTPSQVLPTVMRMVTAFKLTRKGSEPLY
jgi:hypothetical protein